MPKIGAKFKYKTTSISSLINSNLFKKRKKHSHYLKSKETQIINFSENIQDNNIAHEIEHAIEHEIEHEQEYSLSDFESINLNEENNDNENEEYLCLFDEIDEIKENEEIYDEQEPQIKSQNKYDFIYKNSRLTMAEFNLFYRWICQKMKLNKLNRNLLLSFIKNILPADNIIPSSYYKLLKGLNKEKKVSKKCFKICSECYSLYNNGCENKSCVNPKKNKKIDALVFDFKYHLKHIIQKYWTEIKHYKGNLIIN